MPHLHPGQSLLNLGQEPFLCIYHDPKAQHSDTLSSQPPCLPQSTICLLKVKCMSPLLRHHALLTQDKLYGQGTVVHIY